MNASANTESVSGASHMEPLAGRHIPALDGLRGIAIIFVMVYHFFALCTPADNWVDDLVFSVGKAGWIGVDMFFVLSGFLITGILYDSRNARGYFRSFYVRRALRIFPLYYFVLFVLFVSLSFLSTSLPENYAMLRKEQVWFWVYLINWYFAFQGGFTLPAGHFWSLAVEEQFYLVWPFVVLWCRHQTLIVFCAILFCVSLVARISLLAIGIPPTAVYTITFTHMDGLVLGALLAVGLRSVSLEKFPFRLARTVSLISLGLLLTLFVWLGHFSFNHPIVAAVGYSLLALLFGQLLLVSIFSSANSRTQKLLTHPILRSFGKYSYCIYLIHPLIAVALLHYGFRPDRFLMGGSAVCSMAVFVLLAISLCWLGGFFSWHLYEKHFLRLKDRFSVTVDTPEGENSLKA